MKAEAETLSLSWTKFRAANPELVESAKINMMKLVEDSLLPPRVIESLKIRPSLVYRVMGTAFENRKRGKKVKKKGKQT